MAVVIFYEKPGCAGNARQKQVLRAAGATLDVRDLLATPWTADSLRPFFGTRPVADWFNRAAPAIRDGGLEPEKLDAAGALALMQINPLLIRRPLIACGEFRCAGFDWPALAAPLGLAADAAPDAAALDGCVHGPGPAGTGCPSPAGSADT